MYLFLLPKAAMAYNQNLVNPNRRRFRQTIEKMKVTELIIYLILYILIQRIRHCVAELLFCSRICLHAIQ